MAAHLNLLFGLLGRLFHRLMPVGAAAESAAENLGSSRVWLNRQEEHSDSFF